MEKNPGTELAPEGKVWMCCICGKRSKTRYGFDSQNKTTAIDSGWDESCMMHAQLVDALANDQRIIEATS